MFPANNSASTKKIVVDQSIAKTTQEERCLGRGSKSQSTKNFQNPDRAHKKPVAQ